MSRLELSTPELFGSSTFLNTTRRLSEAVPIKVKTQVTVSVCLADWGFPTALTLTPSGVFVTVTVMVAIGFPLSLEITPGMGGFLLRWLIHRNAEQGRKRPMQQSHVPTLGQDRLHA